MNFESQVPHKTLRVEGWEGKEAEEEGREGRTDLSNKQVGNIVTKAFRGYKYEVFHIKSGGFFVSYLLTFISLVFYVFWKI